MIKVWNHFEIRSGGCPTEYVARIDYDALAAENENLKTYGSKPCPICDDYFEENDKLRTANAELVEALKTACNYLEQGKAKFAPSTTNYFVDDFIAKHGSTGWNGSEKL